MPVHAWLLRWVTISVVLFSASSVPSADWRQHESEVYGFSMMIPEMTSLAERRPDSGWGSLRAVYLQTEIWVLVKLGAAVEEIEFRSIALRHTGIMQGDWKVVDQGRNARGFTWFKTLKAYRGATVFYGLYGVGPRGSYVFFLKTDPEHVEKNQTQFDQWYQSITLY